ncbi:HIT family protein [Lacibacterium aquatile]|uniref:HIT family protein n=1 Tax=Lacibacterium aquatile TaxID=1168082 RepID=A0ABW5DVS8_9PROT
MANATQTKFGYPETLIAETDYWTLQTRPAQPTLGSLVLVCKEAVGAFGAVSPEAFADLGRTIPRIEAMLQAAIGYQRINYLMLMMVDPDVHFHVLPRYEGEKRLGDITLADSSWPGAPDLGKAVTLSPAELQILRDHLRTHWATDVTE